MQKRERKRKKKKPNNNGTWLLCQESSRYVLFLPWSSRDPVGKAFRDDRSAQTAKGKIIKNVLKNVVFFQLLSNDTQTHKWWSLEGEEERKEKGPLSSCYGDWWCKSGQEYNILLARSAGSDYRPKPGDAPVQCSAVNWYDDTHSLHSLLFVRWWWWRIMTASANGAAPAFHCANRPLRRVVLNYAAAWPPPPPSPLLLSRPN